MRQLDAQSLKQYLVVVGFSQIDQSLVVRVLKMAEKVGRAGGGNVLPKRLGRTMCLPGCRSLSYLSMAEARKLRSSILDQSERQEGSGGLMHKGEPMVFALGPHDTYVVRRPARGLSLRPFSCVRSCCGGVRWCGRVGGEVKRYEERTVSGGDQEGGDMQTQASHRRSKVLGVVRRSCYSKTLANVAANTLGHWPIAAEWSRDEM